MTQLDFERGARSRRSRPRMTWARKRSGVIICAVLVLIVAILGFVRLTSPPGGPAAPPAPIRYLGVYEPGSPQSYANVDGFARAVGRRPNLVTYYSFWNEDFKQAFAETAASQGATTIVEVEPNVSLAKIASGAYDSYLIRYADEVAAFKHKVVISFGHEMNGYWYSWGYHQTPAGTFKAAWRHFVNVFRQQGANNVIWLWQVNSLSTKTGAPRNWWPGANYVTWVGVSGYYYTAGDPFDNVFNPVVYDIRQFTQDPVLIAETAVGPPAGQERGIADLFAGIRLNRYLGLVWFDQHSTGGLYKGENWRLEGDRTGLAAFRKALKG